MHWDMHVYTDNIEINNYENALYSTEHLIILYVTTDIPWKDILYKLITNFNTNYNLYKHMNGFAESC